MSSQKRHLARVAAFWILLLIVVPAGYLGFLEIVVSHQGLVFHPGLEDDTFSTSYQNPAWLDESFDQGWAVAWEFGQSGNSSGFAVSNNTLTLYATFAGYNEMQDRGVSGIMIEKNTGEFSTIISPFLVVYHRESSSDSALMFSFGVTDAEGLWHDGGWHHASSSWTHLESDLRQIFNGTVESVSLRLTDDFESNYTGGVQYAYVQSIAIYGEPPDWKLTSNELVNASISSEDGVLEVSASGNLSTGTIVSAQRMNNLTCGMKTYDYLKASIKTPSINIAARIVIWTNASYSCDVLVKTYNDTEWHTEIVDLAFFGLTGVPYMIELSMMTLNPANTGGWISYKQLSINSLNV